MMFSFFVLTFQLQLNTKLYSEFGIHVFHLICTNKQNTNNYNPIDDNRNFMFPLYIT